MSFRSVGDANDIATPDDAVFSLIDRHTTVDGSLETQYDLRVDGQVLGTLRCAGTLYVSDGATVDATIEAGNVVVAGSVAGAIRCTGRLEIQASGVVRAEVATASLVILEGAIFEGQIRMEAPAAADDTPAPAAEGAADEQEEPYTFLRRFRTVDEASEPATDLPAAPDDDEST